MLFILGTVSPSYISPLNRRCLSSARSLVEHTYASSSPAAQELWRQWCNVQLMLPQPGSQEYYTEVINMLAFIGREVDAFTKSNLLSESPLVRHILHEVKAYMFFDPSFKVFPPDQPQE